MYTLYILTVFVFYIYFVLSLHFHALSMSEFTFDIMDHGSLGTPINLQPLLLTNARGQTFDGKVCEYTTFIQLSLKHLLCSRQWFESSQWCWRPEPGCFNVHFYKSKKYHPNIPPPPPPPCPEKNRQIPTGLMMLTGTRICGNWQLTTLSSSPPWPQNMCTPLRCWCGCARTYGSNPCQVVGSRQNMMGDALGTRLKSSYPGFPEIFFCSWSSSKIRKFKRREILKWFCSSKIYLFKEVKKKLDIFWKDHLFVVGKKLFHVPKGSQPHFLHFCIYLAEVLQGCHCFAQPSTKKEQLMKNLHKKNKQTGHHTKICTLED